MVKQFLKYLILGCLLLSCRKENATDCLKGNGDVITENRYTDEFRVIKVYDKIDLNVLQGTELKIEVNAGKNILSNIQTRVKNGELIIRNLNKCNFVRGYKKKITVTITLPSIKRVNNEGVGTVIIGPFTQDSIAVRAENSGDIHLTGAFKFLHTSSHGNGDIYLNGSSDTLYAYQFGTNFLRAENFTIGKFVFIETISIGDARVNAPANGTLECNIWRSGNIYYRGNPAFINNYSDGSGKGKLIKE